MVEFGALVGRVRSKQWVGRGWGASRRAGRIGFSSSLLDPQPTVPQSIFPTLLPRLPPPHTSNITSTHPPTQFHTCVYSSNAEDPEDPMAGGVHHSARGACRPLRLPPGLPSGLYRLTSLGLLVSEPHDLQVWGGGGRGGVCMGR